MRVTPEREVEIVDAYEGWDGSDGVNAFAKSVGVSKETLYAILGRNGVITKPRRAFLAPEENLDLPLAAASLVEEVAVLTEELVVNVERLRHAARMFELPMQAIERRAAA